MNLYTIANVYITAGLSKAMYMIYRPNDAATRLSTYSSRKERGGGFCGISYRFTGDLVLLVVRF